MIKDVVSLASSSILGQIINLCVLVAVARLVSVEVYGVYAVCLTLVGYVSVLAGAKYHHVVFAGSREEAGLISAGNHLFTASLSVLGLLGLVFSKYFLDKLSDLSMLDLVLVVMAGYCSAASLFYYYLCLRDGKLKTVFHSRLVPPLIGGVGMVAWSFAIGSQSGILFFYVVTNILALVILRHGFQLSWSVSEVFDVLKKYITYPAFLLPAGALEVFNSGFLLLASADLFGVQASAAFGLYLRLIGSPQGLLVSSVGDSLRRKIVSSDVALIPRLLFRTGISLLGVSLVGTGIIYLFAEYGIAFLLGEKWAYAGQYFIWMLPVFVFSFVVPSLSVTLYVFNGQKYDLLVQMVTFVMYGVVYYRFGQDTKSFIFAFVVASCLKYLLELSLCMKCLRERNEST